MSTATISRKISCDGTVQTAAKAITGDGWHWYDPDIGAPDVDTEVLCSIDTSQLKALFIYAPSSDLVLEANAAASAGCDFTINLDEGDAKLWTHKDEDSGWQTNPISVDVTKFYVTNSGGVATKLYIGVLQDVTP